MKGTQDTVLAQHFGVNETKVATTSHTHTHAHTHHTHTHTHTEHTAQAQTNCRLRESVRIWRGSVRKRFAACKGGVLTFAVMHESGETAEAAIRQGIA